jgi:uncharacterized protein (TIGR03437 family)
MRRFVWLLLCVFGLIGQTDPTNLIPTGERWKTHLTEDLLPFWSMPAALGSPLGAFPAVRCEDGSLIDFANPCAIVNGNGYLSAKNRYLVTQSRQTYGYGVAFHMTGDPRYLTYMKAGVDYIRREMIDPAGGMFLTINFETNEKGPARATRNPQELGYGLLSLGMYYYLTRDAAVWADLVRIKNYIFANYYRPELGAMRWSLQANNTDRRLVANLDQMNTYLVLTAPIAPAADQRDFFESLTTLSHSLIRHYYSPHDNMFFLSANTAADRDLTRSATDFGHSSKTLWMMRFVGQMTGDAGLAEFASQKGLQLFDQAFLAEDHSWAQGVKVGGALDKDKSWWIYNELDQYASTMGVDDRRALKYLPQTTDYYFRNFVDKQQKEIWNGVTFGTNQPIKSLTKAWQWKNAYHSLEHALVGYIGAQLTRQLPVELHFAIQGSYSREALKPYFYSAPVDTVAETVTSGTRYQRVTFRSAPPVAPNLAPSVNLVSAASFYAGPMAPGSLVSAFGTRLAARTEAASTRPLPTLLGGASVTVVDGEGNARQAGMVFADAAQINFVVPNEVAAGDGAVIFSSAGQPNVRIPIRIKSVVPALFQFNTRTSLAAAVVVRQQGTQQTEEPVFRLQAGTAVAQPIDLATGQVYLTIYATGLRGAKSVTASLGSQMIPVTYVGAHSSFAGLDQVNIGPIPRSLAGYGALPLLLIADGLTGNPVELVLK